MIKNNITPEEHEHLTLNFLRTNLRFILFFFSSNFVAQLNTTLYFTRATWLDHTYGSVTYPYQPCNHFSFLILILFFPFFYSYRNEYACTIHWPKKVKFGRIIVQQMSRHKSMSLMKRLIFSRLFPNSAGTFACHS